MLLSLASATHAQNLSKHKWKDRLVVILAADTSLPMLDKQMEELRGHSEGLAERKCEIYRATHSAWSTGLEELENWKDSGKLYEDFKETGADFEVLLIGLDGGIKLRQTELLTCEALFGRIDQMPMRKSELRRKGGR